MPQGINRCLYGEQSSSLDVFDDLTDLSQGELEVKVHGEYWALLSWGHTGVFLYQNDESQRLGVSQGSGLEKKVVL